MLLRFLNILMSDLWLKLNLFSDSLLIHLVVAVRVFFYQNNITSDYIDIDDDNTVK